MDEDDLLQIDEIEDKENDNVPLLININKDISNITKSYKRLICHGLQSEQISMYIQRIPAQFGETRRIETIAQDLFPNLIFSKFSQKKLNYSRKRKLNCALFAESVWQIDRSGNCVCAKTCTGFAERSDICNNCNSLHLKKKFLYQVVLNSHQNTHTSNDQKQAKKMARIA
ncbi:hypothetical protein RirG_117250 [Rhizophagus irregularis DAOM 197198w]|uniref:Uncharacterized protein n=1 Tax=Rhizophagus irregularis (strain DAOM 197198w) TaxID=1432141 RepID=A0A015MJY0_RHIIW|nr:hypothetical protein RirG_117250 [Rhizophagus irregularis DAOM 197198w]